MSPSPALYYGGSQIQRNFPDHFRCMRCNKHKPATAFSSVSRKKFMTGKAHKVPCINCTGSQAQELNCEGCDRVKAVTAFTIAQRRNPDHAKCIKCMNKQVAREPGMFEKPRKDEEKAAIEDARENSIYGTGSMPVAKSVTTVDPGFKPMGSAPHSRVSGSRPSIAAASSTAGTTSGSVFTQSELGARNFARIKAYRPPQPDEPEEEDSESEKEEVESSDEEEEPIYEL